MRSLDTASPLRSSPAEDALPLEEVEEEERAEPGGDDSCGSGDVGTGAGGAPVDDKADEAEAELASVDLRPRLGSAGAPPTAAIAGGLAGDDLGTSAEDATEEPLGDAPGGG